MENSKSDFVTIDQITEKIRRHKWTLISCVGLSLLLVFIYNRVSTPIYSAPAIISFEQYSQDDVLNLGIANVQYESSYITNRTKELRTWTFAHNVFRALPDSVRQLFSLPDSKPTNSSPKKILTKIQDSIGQLLGLSASELSDSDPVRHMVTQIQEGVSVGLVEKGSSILTIAFDLENAELAREVTNTAIDVLKARNLNSRREDFASLKGFVDEQIIVVEKQLDDSEKALQNFKSRYNISSLGDESRELLTRITQAEVLYNQILVDKKANEKRLTVLHQKIDEQKKNISDSSGETSNPMIVKLKEQLLQLKVQSANLQMQGYSDDHPRKQELNTEIEQVKQNLVNLTMEMMQDQNLMGMIDPLSSLKTYLEESVEIEIEIQALHAQQLNLQETLDSYNERLTSLSGKESTLFGLLRDREVTNKIYVNLVEEREQARLKEASELGNMRVIERAQTPLSPYKPRKKLNIIIGLFAGSLIGLAVIFLRDSFNDVLESEEDVETVLDLPVLASIHKIKSKSTVSFNGKMTGSNHHVHMYRDGFTYLWNCLQTLEKNKFKSVMITSACPGEGKSTIATNLAITAAKLGKEVLLIDGDLRKPTLSKLLNVPDSYGVLDLVSPESNIEESTMEGLESLSDDSVQAKLHFPSIQLQLTVQLREALICDLPVAGLKLLTAGSSPNDPGFVWASANFKKALNSLMQKFDFVVIDAPPVLGIPDAVSIGSNVEGTILCVASDQADKTHILRTRKLLAQTKTNVIGVVWNKVNPLDIYGRYEYRNYYQA